VDWCNPNRGWHTTVPDDPMLRHRGLRTPSTGTLVGRGKGTGAALTHGGVARLKAAVVVVQGQGPGDGGASHHNDRSGGGVGRRPNATGQ
jgi:hypothetical protein